MWFVYALLAALVFGIRGILYQWSSQRRMNRNLMLLGVFSTGAIVGLLLAILFDSRWTPAVLLGIVMGLFSFIASASMYRGFEVGKASLIAILTAMPPLVVIVMAYVLWGETLSPWQLTAFVIILAGIVMIRYSSDLSFKQLKGVGWGLLCMLTFGLNDTTNKQATMLEADAFPTLFFMFLTGTICFYLSYRVQRLRSRRNDSGDSPDSFASATQPGESWSDRKTVLWGMLVGTTNIGGMILIFHAFALGVTGLVSAVVALNVLLLLLYSRFFLRERFSPLELSGMTCALIGILLIRMVH